MGDAPDRTHHGTAIALGARAALIVGPSGAGKSDLALRCLALAPGPLIPETAVLVADDRVHIHRAAAGLSVSAPETIRGQLEVRGLGIVEVPFRANADLVLAVELVAPEAVERLPDPPPELDFLGVRLPVLRLAPFEASAPVKLLLTLMQAGYGSGRADPR